MIFPYSLQRYCKFGNFREDLFSRMKINPSQNGEITFEFIDVGKSCPSCEFLTWQICILTLSAKLKFSRNFSNLSYLFEPHL